jgi:hypothetical protein
MTNMSWPRQPTFDQARRRGAGVLDEGLIDCHREKHMTGKPWFVPKRRGYGATPASWQGWGLIFGFAAAVLALAWFIIIAPAQVQHDLSVLRVAAFLAAIAILGAILVSVAKSKSAGDWRWRSGSEDPKP